MFFPTPPPHHHVQNQIPWQAQLISSFQRWFVLKTTAFSIKLYQAPQAPLIQVKPHFNPADPTHSLNPEILTAKTCTVILSILIWSFLCSFPHHPHMYRILQQFVGQRSSACGQGKTRFDLCIFWCIWVVKRVDIRHNFLQTSKTMANLRSVSIKCLWLEPAFFQLQKPFLSDYTTLLPTLDNGNDNLIAIVLLVCKKLWSTSTLFTTHGLSKIITRSEVKVTVMFFFSKRNPKDIYKFFYSGIFWEILFHALF